MTDESAPAWLVLFDYGGRSVWMPEHKARRLAAKFRKKGHGCYIVRRKVAHAKPS